MTTRSQLAAAACAIGIGVFAGAAFAAEVPAAPHAASRRAAMPVEGEITNPDWARKPDGEVLANYYPKLANYLHLSGRVVMKCKVTAAGALEACTIDKETPAGVGFGDAALASAQYFRMKPKLVDGVPVSGGVVVIPMNWRMPDVTLLDDPTEGGAPPTPEALALGRRLFAAMIGNEQAAANYRTGVARAQEQMGSATSTPEGQAALAALDTVLDAGARDYGEMMAIAYAKTFSSEELKGLVAFYESPTGQAWRAHEELLQKNNQYVGQKAWMQIISNAQREFCAKTACLPADAPAAATQTQPAQPAQRAKP